MFEKSLRDVPQENLDEIGIVVQVGDGICTIYGLTNAIYGELIEFEGGNKGIVFGLDEDSVSIFLLYAAIPVAELEVAKRTGFVFKTPVGDAMLGRVINALGKPLDALGDIVCSEHRPIEVGIPQIIERSPISESLETGIMAIDALVPVGKGQRELIIGNRNTGKTSVVFDTIFIKKAKTLFVFTYQSVNGRQILYVFLVCLKNMV